MDVLDIACRHDEIGYQGHADKLRTGVPGTQLAVARWLETAAAGEE